MLPQLLLLSEALGLVISYAGLSGMPDYLISDYRNFTVFYLLTSRKLDFEPVSELFHSQIR
jgi:hypothetical protein